MWSTLPFDMIGNTFPPLKTALEECESHRVGADCKKNLSASALERTLQGLVVSLLFPLDMFEKTWTATEKSLVRGAAVHELLGNLKPFMNDLDSYSGLLGRLSQVIAMTPESPVRQETLDQLEDALRRVRQVSEKAGLLVRRLEAPRPPVDPEKLKPSGKPGKRLQAPRTELSGTADLENPSQAG